MEATSGGYAERAIEFVDLTDFFAPKTVALIGATEDTSKFAGRVLRALFQGKYAGQVYLVNPRGGTMFGLPVYKNARLLPQPIDHFGIAVPAERVLEAVRDCAARGAKFITIFTAGFGETGSQSGRELQDEILQTARAAGIRVMGPNCNGLVSFVDRFVFTATSAIAAELPSPGRVGIASQSGGAGQVNVMLRAQQAGLGISHQVSCGNGSDIDLLDFVNFMIEDPHTDVVMVVAEQIADGRKLAELARRALAREKPIIIQKFGRSKIAQSVALSHTGSIAGSDAIHDAAFRQFGLLRVRDFNELYEAGLLLVQRRYPQDGRLAAVSISGGNVLSIADSAPDYGLWFPEYSAATTEKLRKLIAGYINFGNPTDMSIGMLGNADGVRELLRVILEDPEIDVLVPIITQASKTLEAAADVARHATKPVAVLWTGSSAENPALTPRDIASTGVALYRTFAGALGAVQKAVQYGKFLSRARRSSELQRPKDADVVRARALITKSSGQLSEARSKEVLMAYGFPITRESLAQKPEQALEFARTVDGPVALKISSPDIPHKTEANAVRLGVAGVDAIGSAFADVVSAARRYRPSARIEGVLVQEMVPAGVELLLGMSQDPNYGSVVTVGLGGVLVEILQDVSHRIPPFGDEEARAMLEELRGYRLLESFRGRPRRDIDAIVDLIVRFGWFAYDFKNEITEIDLNPVVALEAGHGCRVVDALIVIDRTQA